MYLVLLAEAPQPISQPGRMCAKLSGVRGVRRASLNFYLKPGGREIWKRKRRKAEEGRGDLGGLSIASLARRFQLFLDRTRGSPPHHLDEQLFLSKTLLEW